MPPAIQKENQTIIHYTGDSNADEDNFGLPYSSTLYYRSLLEGDNSLGILGFCQNGGGI